MTKPSKYLPETEWEVEDFLHRARTGELPINPAWTKARREVLHAAGLEDIDEGVGIEAIGSENRPTHSTHAYVHNGEATSP